MDGSQNEVCLRQLGSGLEAGCESAAASHNFGVLALGRQWYLGRACPAGGRERLRRDPETRGDSNQPAGIFERQFPSSGAVRPF